MKLQLLLLLAIMLNLGSLRVEAMFKEPEIELVPIARVITNLQKQLLQSTNQCPASYHLARVYSMAYATNLFKVPMDKREHWPNFGNYWSESELPDTIYPKRSLQEQKTAWRHLTNAITLYEQAAALAKKSTNYYDQWLVFPSMLGRAWCLEQAGRKADALTAYRQTLKEAWAKEVEEDFDLKQWMTDEVDDIKAKRNPIRKHSHKSLGAGI